MGNNPMKRKAANQRKGIAFWISALCLVAALACMPMLASRKDGDAKNVGTVLSATAVYQDIASQIIGGGTLASESSIHLKLPEAVKLTAYRVGNGDMVSQGDVIAEVDKVSVMTAITGVQATLDELSKQIAKAAATQATDSVKALAGGTVKAIYGQKGDSVQDVMLEHGALAVLSLDNQMAVQFKLDSSLRPGETVLVSVPGGKEAEGRVRSNQNGTLTVTVTDQNYPVGTPVTVRTKDGTALGAGALYIFSPWNATAYSGTISAVQVSEGSAIAAGRTIFRLTDSGYSAEFQRLIDQRHEYEELMQELFVMYRTGCLTAPCDGIVTDVEEDGPFLLADSSGRLTARLLSLFGKDTAQGFVAYAARVTGVSEAGMELLMNPREIPVSDLASLSTTPTDLTGMTEAWHYTGAPLVYLQEADGLLRAAGTARVGDILLAVGDSRQVYWFVLLTGSTDTDASSGGILLSSLSERPDTCTGQADCTARNHRKGCLSQQEPSTGTVTIQTASLNTGVVGQNYTSPLQASDGTAILSGSWNAQGLPSGLSIDPDSGTITGIPATTGSFSVTVSFTYGEQVVTRAYILEITNPPAQTGYLGYAAQIVEIVDGAVRVMQSPTVYPVTDLSSLPTVSADTSEMTVEMTYTSSKINSTDFSKDDLVLIVTDEQGTLVQITKLSDTPGDETGGAPGGGTAPGSGGKASTGNGGGGAGGTAQPQENTLYSLEKITVASVTSQESMTLSVTIDEWDISNVHVGQAAVITVDALAGSRFDAAVTQIAASGTSEGGNSKFTVELTLSKSGDMLPGMRASASIKLDTDQNALCVPAAALGEENGKTILYTGIHPETGEPCNPVTVTIGIADAAYVQILDGVSQGDQVYYRYYDAPLETNAPPF